MPQEALASVPVENRINDVEAWLKAHSGKIYICPRLPGNPRITPETCARRRQLANTIRNRAGNESLFDGGGPVGLDICLDCPVGGQLEEEKVA